MSQPIQLTDMDLLAIVLTVFIVGALIGLPILAVRDALQEIRKELEEARSGRK